ncbi:MAG: glycosyltransferase [Bacteroidia bacterium]
MHPSRKISIIDAEYGGVESRGYSLLSRSLANAGENAYKFTVIQDKTSGKWRKNYDHFPHVKVLVLPVKNKGILGRLLFGFLAVSYAMFFSRVIIMLGVNASIFLPMVRIIPGTKVIVNIDSMRWNQAYRGKLRQIIWKTIERMAVSFSDKIVCSNLRLRDYVKTEYKADAVVIGYGGDYLGRDRKQWPIDSFPIPAFPTGEKWIFCRTLVSPSSGVASILETFARYPRFGVILMGNWKDSEYGQTLYKHYFHYRNILFQEYSDDAFVFGLKNADIFLYNFDAGGTHISLREAMYHKIPVIAADSPINREITNNKAFYFSHAADLTYILHNLRPSVLEANAEQLAKIAGESGLWSIVTDRYFQLIESLFRKKAAVANPVANPVSQIDSGFVKKTNGQ